MQSRNRDLPHGPEVVGETPTTARETRALPWDGTDPAETKRLTSALPNH
jgi:hypothetical protein